MTAQHRTLVWESLLNADMRARYWGYIARRTEKIELAITLFIAVFSGSAVGSWWVWGPASQLWQPFSALAAILAIALPILKLERKVESMANLGARYASLLDAFSQLWRDLPTLSNEEAARRYDDLKRQETALYSDGVRLSHSRRLVKKSQRDVLRARGLAPAV